MGTGLGLSIVFGVASQSGRFVTIEDPPEGGARVRVWLPTVD